MSAPTNFNHDDAPIRLQRLDRLLAPAVARAAVRLRDREQRVRDPDPADPAQDEEVRRKGNCREG